jgi:hypothetical protein
MNERINDEKQNAETACEERLRENTEKVNN